MNLPTAAGWALPVCPTWAACPAQWECEKVTPVSRALWFLPGYEALPDFGQQEAGLSFW